MERRLSEELVNRLGVLFYDFIVRSTLSEKGLSIYEDLKGSKITQTEKYEILAYETFTVLTALQVKLEDRDLDRVSILLTTLLFEASSSYGLNPAQLEKLLGERLREYNQIIATNDDRRVLLLASLFVSNFYDREISKADIRFIGSVKQMFEDSIELLKEKIDNVVA